MKLKSTGPADRSSMGSLQMVLDILRSVRPAWAMRPIANRQMPSRQRHLSNGRHGDRGRPPEAASKNQLSAFLGVRYEYGAEVMERWNPRCVNGAAMGNMKRFERCASPQSRNELAFLGEPILSPERVQEGVLVRRILAGES